ncbi:MAG: type II toxin-antitoxin system death-on-curing family toxin [Hydrogenophaga sp.]|uniref:type II toxin-antitoxin system death-on-curing family toxin n=1 Tax=Hydrogenophaga sp. TaxID=1904254 RepID=UPI001BC0EC11|nr:type II toxin-antitoxin system death-on-curing family toxin [Hydrogenophaga sp.]MBS3912550.1 type II toxin-antitoxin system death-on-curing family toxin [Hydrogenophaga sp.]MDO9149118.1 type II toxin-antitoxin system death-on-curing family toxin [Hydrogenophaga sp.]MDO9604507.1 type II toxin-antitoxin system death-on-curing family toxin [Hydrogenophaga sp.]MDP2163700.1 type II toxin-antitoxin system death-on-curing family toxin [Hydrogenophaga sp.]MDP3475954.1 type II toxin-antitoxin system
MIGRWRFISRRALELLHDESLAEHGGRPGLRDPGLLESALARPHQLLACGDPDLAALAAAFGFGLVRNHAFVDGNKRAAFLATGLFVALNGQRLVTRQAEAALTMLALAAGDLSEDAFAQWLRERLQPRPT